MPNSSIWLIDKTLSVATIPRQSGPGSNGNERVLHIPQISKDGASPSDYLMSYTGYSLGDGSYFSVEMQSVYFIALADWENIRTFNAIYRTFVIGVGGEVLLFCWDAVGVFYSPSWLSYWKTVQESWRVKSLGGCRFNPNHR